MIEIDSLPNGWATAPLAECTSRVTDGTHLPPRFTDAGVPFLFVKHVVDGRITFDDTRFISDETWQTYQRRCPVEVGDVLYTAVGSYGVAVPVTTEQRFSFQRHIAHIKPHCQIDSRYLAYFLNSPAGVTQAHSAARGVAQKTVTLGDLRRFSIRVAPVNEQSRIVAKIEELFSDLDAGVAALERARANLRRYRAAVLKAAIEGKLTEEWRTKHPEIEPASVTIERTSKPARPNRWETRSKDVIPGHAALSVGLTARTLPASWAWVQLADIAQMESGHTPSRMHPEWWDGDIPWIGIADAREHHGGQILETIQHTNDAGLANSAARLLPSGTVCISRTASVGYVVVMGRSMATSQDFVNWIPTSCVTSAWLQIVFMADRNALIRFGKGSVHKTIYFPEWLSVHVAVPPVAEQVQIAEIVAERLSQIDASDAAIEHGLLRAARLRQSILKQAFEGKLVPQDTNDEPADRLLERIRAARLAHDGNGRPIAIRARRAKQAK